MATRLAAKAKALRSKSFLAQRIRDGLQSLGIRHPGVPNLLLPTDNLMQVTRQFLAGGRLGGCHKRNGENEGGNVDAAGFLRTQLLG